MQPSSSNQGLCEYDLGVSRHRPEYVSLDPEKMRKGSYTHIRAEENIASLSRSILAFNSGSTFLPTVSMTAVNCSLPITPILALGHIHRNRGEYARPHIP